MAEGVGALGQRAGIFGGFGRGCERDRSGQLRLQLDQGLAEGDALLEQGTEPVGADAQPVARATGGARQGNAPEERPRHRVDRQHLAPHAAGIVGEKAGVQQPFRVAHEVFDADVAERDAEVLRGDILELVRFVDDRIAAGRDDFAEGTAADRGIRAEQVMVHDHEV